MRKLFAVGASVLIAGSMLVMGVSPASAAQHDGYLGHIAARVASIQPLPIHGGHLNNRAAPTCVPKINEFNRTQLCWKETITVSIFNTQGELVGTDVLTMILSDQLAIKSLDYTETDTVTAVDPSGEIPSGFNMTLAVSCGAGCRVINKFPPGSPVKPGIKGTLDYSESVASGAFNLTQTSYTLNFAAPNFTQIQPAKWNTPIDVRCDDMLKGQSAGCVFGASTPTLTTMAGLPHIAASIKKIQTNGPGHYGRPGSGNPLHYMVDNAQRDKNQRAVCGRSVVGPPPPGKSCDEYPFASTYEGGTALSPPNRGWAWVPEAENNSQGGRLKTFIYASRLLDADAFYVKV